MLSPSHTQKLLLAAFLSLASLATSSQAEASLEAGNLKRNQYRYLEALEAYAETFQTHKADATGKLAAQEISACLQLMDMPLEQASWDRYVSGNFQGQNPLDVRKVRQKYWPIKKHSPDYIAAVKKALAASTDIWGEELMRRPEGPTYENMKDLLEPLQLVHGSFHYYAIPLSQKNGILKGRLAGNGNQIGVGLPWSQVRIENVGWWRPQVAVRFFVGNNQERFGDDDARRVGPQPFKGYLPIYTTEYVSDGKKYVQQVLCEGDPNVVKVAITVPAGGKLSILVENQLGGLEVKGDAFVNESKAVLCSVRNAALSRLSDFPRFGLAQVSAGSSKTVYLSIPCSPAIEATAPDETSFSKSGTAVAAYWDNILNEGAKIEVPEEIVMNAWRSTLIGNYCILRENAMLYSFGNIYETYYTYEATRPIVAFSLYGHHADALTYYDIISQIPSAEFHRAAQVWTAWELYLLGESDDFMRQRIARLTTYVDQLNGARKNDPKGLQPPGVYAGDIGHIQVHSLDHNMGAYAAIRNLGLLLKSLGEKDTGDQYYQDSQEYRKVILKAIEDSLRTDSTPPFIPQSLYGNERPYPHIPADGVGSYYNIVMSRIQDTGVFGPHDKWMGILNQFLEQRGGRLLGLLRFNQQSSLYTGDGADDTYQIDYDKSLLLRNEVDRFLVAFYGKLAHGMTRDTFIGAEVTQIAPEEGESGRRMYLPPNSTTNAHFLFDLREMLVLEEDDDMDGNYERLCLLKGTPRAWLSAGKRISFSQMPTYFGPMSASLEVSKDGKTVSGEIDLPAKRPIKTALLRLRRPNGFRLQQVTLNGKPFEKFDGSKEEIDLSGQSGKINLIATYK